jgi:hypothetical protein
MAQLRKPALPWWLHNGVSHPMPRGYRRALCASIGLILATVANAQSVHHHARSNGSTTHSHQATSPPPVIPLDVQNTIRRIADALESANEQKNPADEQRYNGRYLQSQEQLARWAKWTFFVACFESLVAAIVVVLVWLILKAARNSATEARMAAKETKRQADIAQQMFASLEMPYVYPIALRYFVQNGHIDTHAPGQRSYTFTSADGGVCIAAKVKNYGRAPARMETVLLRVSVVPADAPTGDALFSEENRFWATTMLGENDESTEFKIGPMPKAMNYIDDIEGRSKCLLVFVSVHYHDAFGSLRVQGSQFHWDPERQDFGYGFPDPKQPNQDMQ